MYIVEEQGLGFRNGTLNLGKGDISEEGMSSIVSQA